MNKGKLVGFIGAKGAGKTTLAKWCCRIQWTKRMSFATPMRRMLEAIGVSRYYHTDNKDKPVPVIAGNPTARHLMQTLGTEWGRDSIHKDIWVKAAIEMVNVERSMYDVLMDDCRFPNEVKAIREAGGIIVRVNPSHAVDLSDTHESEAHWRTLDYDYLLENDGTLDDLKAAYEALNI